MLLQRGHRVRALTRNSDAQSADALRNAGADIVAGDLERPETLTAAVDGADAVFVVATPFEAGPEAETRQARNLIDAAVAAGVAHVVYSSVASADQATGIPHFESKYAVEEHLRASDARWTIVAPAMFMDMLLAPWSLPGLREGRMSAPIPANVPGQMVAVADIGTFTALVIEQPERFAGQRVEIAGDVSTGGERAIGISRHAGRSVEYRESPLEQAGDEDLIKMYQFLIEEGYQVDVSALRQSYPEVGWRDLDAWAAEQDWPALMSTDGKDGWS